jgi:hypothetical protein
MNSHTSKATKGTVAAVVVSTPQGQPCCDKPSIT